jgi:AraC-like DNA-binding protein
MLDLYNIATPFRITGVYTAYEFSWDSDGVFKGESHDFWELVTVISGQLEVVEDDRYYVLESGMTVCHAPGEFHRLKSAGGTSPRFLVLTFGHDGRLPERLREGVFTLDKKEQNEFLELFYILESFYKESRARARRGEASSKYGNAEVCAILELGLFLLRLSESDVSRGVGEMSESAREYRRLVRSMTENTNENLSLSQLSERHHISESYIKKLFRTYAGEGAMSYYARLRTAEIKRLLDEGRSVAETAELMNFSSSSYLSTFFKKQTGMTPSEYTERNRK